MIHWRTAILSAFAALSIPAAPALSQDAPPTPRPDVATDNAIAVDPPAPAALDDTALQDLNGRQGVTVVAASEQLLNAINSGNSVNGQTIGSGDIVIGAGAFSGFNGIGNFVMNSGHNNNLQGAITINIATGAPTP